jgi:hypothetical protein
MTYKQREMNSLPVILTYFMQGGEKCLFFAITSLLKDDNVKDEGAPDPRTVQFRPGRKPGLHLGRQSQYYLF